MRLRLFIVGILVFIMGVTNSTAGSPSWLLLEYQNEGHPIVMKIIEELPSESVRERFGWLTVISWRYDRTENNGMPSSSVNGRMIDLEKAIDNIQENKLCFQVYGKTGNGLKELAYYIGDRDEFMKALNVALANHPRYPLDIEFFNDPDWRDLQTVHEVYLDKE